MFFVRELSASLLLTCKLDHVLRMVCFKAQIIKNACFFTHI